MGFFDKDNDRNNDDTNDVLDKQIQDNNAQIAKETQSLAEQRLSIIKSTNTAGQFNPQPVAGTAGIVKSA